MLITVVALAVLAAEPSEIAEHVCTQLHQAATGQMKASEAKKFGGTIGFRLDDFRERWIQLTGKKIEKTFSKGDTAMITKTLRSDADDFVEYCSRFVVDLLEPCGSPDSEGFPQCVRTITPALSCVQHTVPWAYLFRQRHSLKGDHKDIPGTLDTMLFAIKNYQPCRDSSASSVVKALPDTSFDKGIK